MIRQHIVKLGATSVILLLALALTGVSYGMWIDTIDIAVTSHTGTLLAEMTAVSTSNATVSWSGSPGIGSSPSLVLYLNNTEPGDYTVSFTLQNTGTLPFKIIAVEPASTPADLLPYGSVAVTGIAIADQLEPGQNRVVTLSIHLTSTCSANFNTSVSVVIWNQYH